MSGTSTTLVMKKRPAKRAKVGTRRMPMSSWLQSFAKWRVGLLMPNRVSTTMPAGGSHNVGRKARVQIVKNMESEKHALDFFCSGTMNRARLL